MRRRASFLGLSSFFGGKMILLAPSKEHEEDKSGGGRDRQPRPPSWPLSSFLLPQRSGLYLGKFPPRRPRSSSKVHVKVAATFRAARSAEHGGRRGAHSPRLSHQRRPHRRRRPYRSRHVRRLRRRRRKEQRRRSFLKRTLVALSPSTAPRAFIILALRLEDVPDTAMILAPFLRRK